MINERLQAAQYVAEHVERLLYGFNHEHGIPTDVVLAAALGQITTLVAVNQGSAGAAGYLRLLADQIEAGTTREQIELRAATPAGRP